MGGSVSNSGWMIENVDKDCSELSEEIRIRGFEIKKVEQLEKFYGEPGNFCLKA